MSRSTVPFDRLAQLQRLAVLQRRGALEEACAETDRRDAAVEVFIDDLRRAEEGYAASHATGHLCLSRMTVSAAIVSICETALLQGQTAQQAAYDGEAEAGSAWLLANHRAEWFAESDRQQRKRTITRRSERTETELRGLKLALARESCRDR